MAAYAGTVELVFGGVGFGNKRASLLRVKVTNYNSTGIPLTPQIAGIGSVIEGVILCGLEGTLLDANSPFQITYNKANGVCHCYSKAGTEVPIDTNIYSSSGNIMLFVIGA